VAVDATFPNDIPLDALRMHVGAFEQLAKDLRQTYEMIVRHMRQGPEPASEAAIAEIVATAPPVLVATTAEVPTAEEVRETMQQRGYEWVCPTHAAAVTKTSTRTGRTYRACPQCDEIERRTVS
jgi:hypothetical protein